jgi:REP element-mobilizing transposase RayT
MPDIFDDPGAVPCIYPEVNLTDIGLQVNTSILKIPILYKGIFIDQYVIMPNHIHMVLIFTQDSRRGSLPLQDVIGRFKSYTTYIYNQISERKGLILWQRNFYEHVIRDEQSLNEIQEYIINNPLKWYEDKYYTK